MTVGLPGTGIGGLFYILLVLWMPVHETWMTAGRRSSIRRWTTVLFQVSVVGGILGALWAEAWGIRQLLATPLGSWLMASTKMSRAHALDRVVPATGELAALTSVVTLGAVLLTAHLLHVLRRRRVSEPRRAQVATSVAPTLAQDSPERSEKPERAA